MVVVWCGDDVLDVTHVDVRMWAIDISVSGILLCHQCSCAIFIARQHAIFFNVPLWVLLVYICPQLTLLPRPMRLPRRSD